MKKILTLTMIAVLGFGVFNANAQRVTIQANMQPAWAPANSVNVAFYYIPEMNVYFDVVKRQYIYPNGNRWVYANALPAMYRHYDMGVVYKVPLNRTRPPYEFNARDKNDYGKFANAKYHNRQGKSDNHVRRERQNRDFRH